MAYRHDYHRHHSRSRCGRRRQARPVHPGRRGGGRGRGVDVPRQLGPVRLPAAGPGQDVRHVGVEAPELRGRPRHRRRGRRRREGAGRAGRSHPDGIADPDRTVPVNVPVPSPRGHAAAAAGRPWRWPPASRSRRSRSGSSSDKPHPNKEMALNDALIKAGRRDPRAAADAGPADRRAAGLVKVRADYLRPESVTYIAAVRRGQEGAGGGGGAATRTGCGPRSTSR